MFWVSENLWNPEYKPLFSRSRFLYLNSFAKKTPRPWLKSFIKFLIRKSYAIAQSPLKKIIKLQSIRTNPPRNIITKKRCTYLNCFKSENYRRKKKKYKKWKVARKENILGFFSTSSTQKKNQKDKTFIFISISESLKWEQWTKRWCRKKNFSHKLPSKFSLLIFSIVCCKSIIEKKNNNNKCDHNR